MNVPVTIRGGMNMSEDRTVQEKLQEETEQEEHVL
jgi:hypothetical protein